MRGMRHAAPWSRPRVMSRMPTSAVTTMVSVKPSEPSVWKNTPSSSWESVTKIVDDKRSAVRSAPANHWIASAGGREEYSARVSPRIRSVLGPISDRADAWSRQ